jgi:tetratricopeptide (TPR) repeat protein
MMYPRLIFSLFGVLIFSAAAGPSLAAEPGHEPAEPRGAPPAGEILRIPGFPPVQLPPGFGADVSEPPKKDAEVAPSRPELRQGDGAQKSSGAKKAVAPKLAPEALRRQMLDDLFKRLAAAGDEEDSKPLAAAIERLWLRNESETANLLMQRAVASINAGHLPLALAILDKIVMLEPDWAEAWNKRAATRFLADDLDGAMVDINQVLKLEPRHFGALTGMGFMLKKAGLDKRALEAFRRALAIYPQQSEVRKLVEKLSIEVEGRDI